MNCVALSLAIVLCLSSFLKAELRTHPVEYKDGDTTCVGYLAYEDTNTNLRPAVLVVPEWWGLDDYPKHRADQLAKMGYVAFVADIYGQCQNTHDPGQAGTWAKPFQTDRTLFRRRATAGLNTLLDQKYVDKSRVAAIGYCFGGTGVLELARAGAPLVGVVSFHGALARTDEEGPDAIKAKILVCHGADDPMVPARQLAEFETEMKESGANYQINIYSGAVHAFTNPAADSHHISGIGYSELADHRSWAAMKDFFEEVFK